MGRQKDETKSLPFEKIGAASVKSFKNFRTMEHKSDRFSRFENESGHSGGILSGRF